MTDTWQPGVMDYLRQDGLGRQVPHLIGTPLAWIMAVPGAHERIRNVPARAVVEQRDTEVLLDCPCGAHPVIETGDGPAALQKCTGCERWYLVHTGRVLVVYGDMPVPRALSDAPTS